MNRHNSTFRIKASNPLRRSRLERGTKQMSQRRKSVEGDTAWYEQRLDDIVSKIIRALYPACVLCGESDSEKLQCGHFWKRFRRPTRWHMDNLATLCADCNARDNEEHSHFEYWIFNRLGERGYADLAEIAHVSKVFTESELEEMLIGFRALLAELKAA